QPGPDARSPEAFGRRRDQNQAGLLRPPTKIEPRQSVIIESSTTHSDDGPSIGDLPRIVLDLWRVRRDDCALSTFRGRITNTDIGAIESPMTLALGSNFGFLVER